MQADVKALLKLPREEAFRQWLGLAGEWVEEPNIRRGGESGVKRVITTEGKMLYRKQQVGHIYRPWHHPFGYPTAMREQQVLLACADLHVTVPTLVYADCRKVGGVWGRGPAPVDMAERAQERPVGQAGKRGVGGVRSAGVHRAVS